MSQKIFITGVSGAFGKLTSLALAEKGHQVVGSMRTTGGKNTEVAAALRTAGVKLVEMDVTSDESVEQGVKQAVELLGTLDVVINNAGVGSIGLMEAFTPADMQKVFDVNVFGVQRVMRAAAPLLRKQGKGTVIQISSCIGRLTGPFYGTYSASKWALEALAESYRNELAPFGIESCIVEPGGMPTGFMDSLLRPSDQATLDSYGDMAKVPEIGLQHFTQAVNANPAQRPEKVAEAIAALLDQAHGEKPFRIVVDHMGMAEGVEAYNELLHNVTRQVYTSFGNADMLSLNK
ncbi:MAG: SDR family oxidoreductase [Bacteroidota bacterium]